MSEENPGRGMVAGALKNPWAGPGRCLRFGEDIWKSGDAAAEWTEHEVAAGEFPAFRQHFAGKDRAATPDAEDGEFLFVEEVAPEGRVTGGNTEMTPIPADAKEVRPAEKPKFNRNAKVI